MVEGRKPAGGGWIFRSFDPSFITEPPVGVVGETFHWQIKVHDPHGVFNPVLEFNGLPDWLHLDQDTLIGIPPDAVEYEFEVCCTYTALRYSKTKETLKLSQVFTIQIEREREY